MLLPLRLNGASAIGIAVLVTFLWSTSFVLIKFGLKDIPSIDFAAYRYGLASLLLVAATGLKRENSATLSRRDIFLLIALAITGYTLAQGLQFMGLDLLSADMTSFLQNTTPLFVLAVSYPFSRERQVKIQLVGLVLAFAGLFAFFYSQELKFDAEGVILILIGSLSWAIYLVLLRISRLNEKIGQLRFTAITMSIGSIFLLVLALFLNGIAVVSSHDWLILTWLSVVNTAVAFYLWNLSTKILSAFELSILQNTMLVQIAILSFYFLAETLTPFMLLGMALILIGSAMVQLPELRPSRSGKDFGKR
jgi:drug/metabolite transporter (DMT)-like permease